MKAKQVSPTSAAAAANSIMVTAAATTTAAPHWHPAGICGIQKLWFSSGNVIGPSHHVGPLEEMCVASHTPGVAERGQQTGLCVIMWGGEKNL